MLNHQFSWLNPSTVQEENGKYTLMATPKSDFFCNGGSQSDTGITPESLCNAPYYYTEIKGDFVWKVKVSHDFVSVYDSSSIMVMVDLNNWAKTCFELTDFGTRAAVSVVTKNGESDDANGCNVQTDALWLQVTRVGRSFAFHYSLDGVKYDMTRFFTLPAGETVKVGMLAQSPTGEGGERHYENLTIEYKTVANIRAGE
ncbi:MAG: DUF1349 domain-containing protein [Massiliimalia sp.]